jgi:hypothetical protein
MKKILINVISLSSYVFVFFLVLANKAYALPQNNNDRHIPPEATLRVNNPVENEKALLEKLPPTKSQIEYCNILFNTGLGGFIKTLEEKLPVYTKIESYNNLSDSIKNSSLISPSSILMNTGKELINDLTPRNREAITNTYREKEQQIHDDLVSNGNQSGIKPYYKIIGEIDNKPYSLTYFSESRIDEGNKENASDSDDSENASDSDDSENDFFTKEEFQKEQQIEKEIIEKAKSICLKNPELTKTLTTNLISNGLILKAKQIEDYRSTVDCWQRSADEKNK